MYTYVTAVLGVFVLLAFWTAVQHWVRKNSPELPPDCDMLEVHPGCAHCQRHDSCAVTNAQDSHLAESADE